MWCETCNSGPDPKTGRCRCAVQPQPGDKVRVVVHWPHEYVGVVTNLEPGWMHTVEDDGTERSFELPGAFPSEITVVERADDPSRDLVGTVATLVGVGVLFVKVRSNRWEGVGGALSRDNDDMKGRKVTGAVPGTPAAQAQQKCPHCDRLYMHRHEHDGATYGAVVES